MGLFFRSADHARQVFSLESLVRKSLRDQRALLQKYCLTVATHWLQKLPAKGSPRHKKNSLRRKTICYSQRKIALENLCALSVSDVSELLDFGSDETVEEPVPSTSWAAVKHI